MMKRSSLGGTDKQAGGEPTVIVSGMIAGVPRQGGATWAVLQYLLGLRRLGHQVCFIEPLAESSLQPAGAPLEQSTSAAYFRDVVAEFDLVKRAALLLTGTRQTVGLSYRQVCDAARRAEMLINIAGMLTDAELTSAIPLRVY